MSILSECAYKTVRRLCEDFAKTLRRLCEDFVKTLRRLCEDSTKSPESIPQACEPKIGGAGLGFRASRRLYENLWKTLWKLWKTPGRLCEDSGKTLRRLLEDFAKTPGRLWEGSGKTLRRLREACRRRASGDGPKFLEVSEGVLGRGFLGNPLGFPHRMCQSSGWNPEIGWGGDPDEIRKQNQLWEWGGDPDENFRNRVGRRSGWKF